MRIIFGGETGVSVVVGPASVAVLVPRSATKTTAARGLGEIAGMLDRDGNLSARDAVMKAAGEIDEDAAINGFDDFFADWKS